MNFHKKTNAYIKTDASLRILTSRQLITSRVLSVFFPTNNNREETQSTTKLQSVHPINKIMNTKNASKEIVKSFELKASKSLSYPSSCLCILVIKFAIF